LKRQLGKLPENAQATIFITCVDSVKARFGIAEILKALDNGKYYHHKPKYWLDYGNSQYTGQVLLSTIGDIKQPNSDIYETVANLPMVTDEFGALLKQSEQQDDTPSCSLAKHWKNRIYISIRHWLKWVVLCYGVYFVMD
jgi:hypothetical protein